MDAVAGPGLEDGDAAAAGTLLDRRKTSEAVVAFLLEGLFEGRMRSGERVDVDQIAAKLGVSRSPVREALVVLERDGIVSTRFHRGAYVEPFTAESIVDNFEIYGTLSGLAVARLARRPDPDVVAQLQRLLGELRATPADQSDRLAARIQEIMRIQHRAGGSARLRAELRSFAGFGPWVFRVAGGRNYERAVRGQARVVRAIADGDADQASRYRVEDFTAAGREVAAELTRRGILDERGQLAGQGGSTE